MDSDDRLQRDLLLRGAVLAGDERAWQTWYGETFEGLYRYVYWRCAGLRELADEVVQDTWLTAVRRVRRFDPRRGTFAAWLRGIAANVIRNQLRKERTTDRRRRSLANEPATAEAAACELDSRERARRVMTALDSLSDRHEAVLRAKYLDGASVAEIAQTWDETPKAVESLLTRARQRFRETYVKLVHDDEMQPAPIDPPTIQ
jgi:RNA polymerase sigma-70 factor (ECF subfamily)